MLPKRNRLHIGKFYDTLRSEGKKIKSSNFQFIYRYSDNISPQLSVVVGKRIAKKSTQRNKNRRIIFNIFKNHLSQFPKNIQALCIPYKDLAMCPRTDLEAEVQIVMSKL